MNKQRVYLVIGILLALLIVLVSVAEAVPSDPKLQKARLLTPTKTVQINLVEGDYMTFDWTDVRNADDYWVFIQRFSPDQGEWYFMYDVIHTPESNCAIEKSLFVNMQDNEYRWYVISKGSGYTDSWSRTAYFTVV